MKKGLQLVLLDCTLVTSKVKTASLQWKVSCKLFQRKFLFTTYLILFWIFARTSFLSFVFNLYLENAFGAKEISEIHRYRILLNVLWLLNCWYCGSRICCPYTLTPSLSLVFPSSVSPIYSPWHLPQMATYIRLKLSRSGFSI